MILRAMGLGFVLWLANAAIFRFAGPYFFTPSVAPPYLLGAAAVAAGVVLTFICVRILNVARGDEGEAAVAVAFPSLLLNALLTYAFSYIFTLDDGLDGIYGGLALLYGASMVFTGLLMTKLAAKDERV
ncbi:MAG: DUF5367 family protein [Hyphomonadaceae bacterium]